MDGTLGGMSMSKNRQTAKAIPRTSNGHQNAIAGARMRTTELWNPARRFKKKKKTRVWILGCREIEASRLKRGGLEKSA